MFSSVVSNWQFRRLIFGTQNFIKRAERAASERFGRIGKKSNQGSKGEVEGHFRDVSEEKWAFYVPHCTQCLVNTHYRRAGMVRRRESDGECIYLCDVI